MKHSEYLSRHGGLFVETLLDSMELAVDSKWTEFQKWLHIRKAARYFAKHVWDTYQASKKLGNKGV